MTQAGFDFIDLFAGIGGLRVGFENIGGRCVFTSEWNAFSQTTYKANFGEAHPIAGDITGIHEADIPAHDVLLAGFPCQPFSIAGVSKKNSLAVEQDDARPVRGRRRVRQAGVGGAGVVLRCHGQFAQRPQFRETKDGKGGRVWRVEHSETSAPQGPAEAAPGRAIRGSFQPEGRPQRGK